VLVKEAKEGVTRLLAETVKVCPLALALVETCPDSEATDAVCDADEHLLTEAEPV